MSNLFLVAVLAALIPLACVLDRRAERRRETWRAGSPFFATGDRSYRRRGQL